jgi:hypothetical protein
VTLTRVTGRDFACVSRRRPIGLAAVLTCAVLCIFGLGRAPAPDPTIADLWRTSSQTPSPGPSTDQPAFRLGTGAKPFGWSTVIADFDRDGRPDVAVADHVGRHDGAYAYRIEFLVAGRAPADVEFESTADAVTIRTVDVDHDDDLDIVVDRPLGGDTVGVWLNDGRGHFTAATSNQLPSALQAADTLTSSDRSPDAVTLGSTSRRGHVGFVATVVRLQSDAHAGPVAPAHDSPSARSSFLLVSPRGPPHFPVHA